MRTAIGLILLVAVAQPAAAENWVEVGADPQAKFYVDIDSIKLIKGSLRVVKRGIYTHTLTENLDGVPTTFKETRGLVELDCELRVNRVIRIDMIDQYGEVMWSSGDMPRQIWLTVKPNSHSESTLEEVCARFHPS